MKLVSFKNSFIPIITCLMLFLINSGNAFETTAPYAYLYDYNTKTALLNKKGDVRMGPSSMTKLMTSYMIFNALKNNQITMETEFLVSEKAWKKGGSKMFVKVGDKVSVKDLLHGIIVVSGNDACIVAAEGLAGSEDAFAEDMNFMAKELGLKDTNFKNSTGWPDDEHYMTAHDLAILSERLIRDFPDYYYLYSEKEMKYSGIKQNNRNRLLWKDIGVDGLKTGHTQDNGYGITVSAERDGRRLVSVVNGLKTEKERIKASEELLAYGFGQFITVPLYKKGSNVTEAEVWLGNKKTVNLISNQNVEIIRKRRSSQQADITLEVTYKSPWPAPIKKGTYMANLAIKRDGKVEREVPLYAAEDIKEMSFLQRMIEIPYNYLFGE